MHRNSWKDEDTVKKKIQLTSLQLSRETIHQLDKPAAIGCETNSTVPPTLSRVVSCRQ